MTANSKVNQQPIPDKSLQTLIPQSNSEKGSLWDETTNKSTESAATSCTSEQTTAPVGVSRLKQAQAENFHCLPSLNLFIPRTLTMKQAVEIATVSVDPPSVGHQSLVRTRDAEPD